MIWYTYKCETVTTIVLTKTSMSHNYHFFLVVRTLIIYSHGNFQIYNTVLIIITMLYITLPEFIHLKTETYCIKYLPYPPTPQSLKTTISVCFSLAILDSTYKWCMVFIFIWPTSHSIIPSRSIHFVKNNRINIFLMAV